MATYDNGSGLAYPLTKMNFLVTADSVSGTAAFSEVSGIEATVDVIEFRQGNANSMAPVKIPGLVKHGNVTLKMGVCPECGRTYVAGGETTTRIEYSEDNPYEKNRKQLESGFLIGNHFDVSS